MIPLFKPYMPDLPELDTILHSGKLSYGQYSIDFENQLKDFFGTENLFVTNSYSSAIDVVINVLGLKPGDEIIMSPMSCLVSTLPFASRFLHIVWADVIPNKGTLNPQDVENKITPKTKAIVHNHFCGYPGLIDEINTIGKKYDIPVIDDCIEAFGSKYKGVKVGNCGTDITIFSLSPTRMLTTIDGGIVIFREKKKFKKGLLIRDCGIDRSKFRDDIGEINPKCDVKVLGYSAMMSNVSAYIGIKQLEQVDRLLEKNKSNAFFWKTQNLVWLDTADAEPNYWVFGTLCSDKRESIVEYRKKGFYASGVHINNNIYSIFKNKINLPGVNYFVKHFVALPCGWWFDGFEL